MPRGQWSCTYCGLTIKQDIIPRNWYGIARYSGSYDERPSYIATLCCATCLVAYAPQVLKREEEVGDNWTYFPNTFTRGERS